MKNKQGLTIAALIIAIVGLSIGFAAFSNTLTISSSATVNPSAENFKVVFAKNTNVQSLDTTNVTPTKNLDNVTGFTAENAVINNEALNGPALTHLKANFTAPGQSVTYTLNVVNAGAYVAYLKELTFANATNATGSETYKHCYAATTDSNGDDIPAAQQATPSLVEAACNGISISVSIGASTNITPASASKSLGNQSLAANGGNVQATITISYANNAAYVDGPMEVEFGDISFTASSNPAVAGQQEQGGNEQQGGQEEPQQIAVDPLIPTDAELEKAGDPTGDAVLTYNFVDSNQFNIDYKEYGTAKFVTLAIEAGENASDDQYIWFCDSDSAGMFGELDAFIWYNMEDGMPSTPYTGSSPISLSDFNSEDIKSESYVTRVINSFSNNG